MKFTMLKRLVFLIAVFLPAFSSCEKAPGTQTIYSFVRASEAYSQGRFLQTMEILEKENKFPPSLILRAKAEFFYGDLEKAEKSCRRVIKLRPSSLEASLYLARILRSKGDAAGAVKAAESLLADNPHDIRALRFAAELASDSRRFDEAVIYLDRASELSAESALVLLDRARLRWTFAGTDEDAVKAALEDLSRAKAMLPWDTPLLRSILNLERIINGVM